MKRLVMIIVITAIIIGCDATDYNVYNVRYYHDHSITVKVYEPAQVLDGETPRPPNNYIAVVILCNDLIYKRITFGEILDSNLYIEINDVRIEFEVKNYYIIKPKFYYILNTQELL